MRSLLMFYIFLVLLCVCVCVGIGEHGATRQVSTRGHVLFTDVLCVACLLCVRFFSLFFRFACVCVALLHSQVHQPAMRDANE